MSIRSCATGSAGPRPSTACRASPRSAEPPPSARLSPRQSASDRSSERTATSTTARSTMSPRPFRFGAKATKATSAEAWTDLARQAEDLGYAIFQMNDHMGNQLAIVPALMSAADATSKIQIGPHVAGVYFRNPAVIAKECATIDLLSEGRFTLGIGAGWSEKDYAIAGVHQDSAITRIGRLREAVQVIKGLWSEGPFSFEGEHYRVAEVDAVPKPYSPIPIMIGGGGPKILA